MQWLQRARQRGGQGGSEAGSTGVRTMEQAGWILSGIQCYRCTHPGCRGQKGR